VHDYARQRCFAVALCEDWAGPAGPAAAAVLDTLEAALALAPTGAGVVDAKEDAVLAPGAGSGDGRGKPLEFRLRHSAQVRRVPGRLVALIVSSPH
jgi:hypothetical protein